MQYSKSFSLLKISVFLIFIGRAWQHLFWDAPFRSFFWDESLLKPVIEGLFHISWKDYATSESTDFFIQKTIRVNGLIYLIAAVATITIRGAVKKWQKFCLYLGGTGLLILTILTTKEKFYHIAQFFEHSIQFGLPFFLLWHATNKNHTKKVLFVLKVLIAITFFSHGLYAFGFYPVPGEFIDMVIQIFGLSENSAIRFLYGAGILDFVIAFCIFIPKISNYALWYCVVWGLLTALARIVANFYWEFPFQSLHQNMYAVLYRLPHGLVPFLVLVMMKDICKKNVDT